MRRISDRTILAWIGASLLLAGPLGCTSFREYVANGFKVGHDYARPPAPVAEDWIDSEDLRGGDDPQQLAAWWRVFDSSTLDALVDRAVRQNLTLQQAGFRVMQARAARAIAAGNLLPQQQQFDGDYSRNALSKSLFENQLAPQRYFDQWTLGFNLAWELDFWGRFRRAVEAADADLNATVEAYDEVLVTLLGDVAATYVEICTLQQRVEYARRNVELQKETCVIVDARFRGGQVSELDVDQATSTLAQTEATIPQLELQIRLATNRLCILLGTPPEEMQAILGKEPIPNAPAEIAIGIPAQLLNRRPDVRRAERQVAAQSARVGVATSELYPHIAVTGTLGLAANDFSDLFQGRSMTGSIGPSFQWNILNYGRLLNNIRLQDAKLAELISAYQQSVLTANAEVEDGLARFFRSHQQAEALGRGVTAAEKAAKASLVQYRGGLTDFNRVTIIQQNLVGQEDQLAQAQGETALGLIEIHRALGGGWQIRLHPARTTPVTEEPFEEMADATDEPEPVPAATLPAVPKP